MGGVVVSWNPAIGTLKPFHEPFALPALAISHSRYTACADAHTTATPPHSHEFLSVGVLACANVFAANGNTVTAP